MGAGYADTGILHGKIEQQGPALRCNQLGRLTVCISRQHGAIDVDRDNALLGEFNGIADQIIKHLRQPKTIAGHFGGHVGVKLQEQFQTFSLNLHAEQVNHVFKQRLYAQRQVFDFQVIGLNLGVIENIIENIHQRFG